MRAPEFWSQPERSFVSYLLTPLGALYAAAGSLRRATARTARAPCPVICIGNLSAGGTGKTPVALAVADLCEARGRAPMFLTRGYGGRERGPCLVDPARHSASDVGDEALLLARRAPTVVSADRAKGARLARPGSILIMDDGFQNPSLHKDLSLVVVDGDVGFGNGAVIPAGPLREPLRAGLARADALAVMGDGARAAALTEMWRPRPLLRARLVPDPAAVSALAGTRVLAFAGIGRPAKFFQTLTASGAILAGQEAFPDHHVFSDGEIARLNARAQGASAKLVTTEKDWVRLTPAQREGIATLPVTALFDSTDALDTLLARLT